MTNNNLEKIKSRVGEIYKTKPLVHLDLAMKGDRTRLENELAEITAVYPNIFILKECKSGKCHTLQYVDLITNNAHIREMDD